MTAFDRLGRQIAREQDALRAHAPHRATVRERLDALHIPARAQAFSALRSALRGRATSTRRTLIAGIGAIAAAALAAAAWPLFASRPLRPALAAFTASSGEAIAVGAWIEASEAEPLAIRFSDGTYLEIASHTRARLVEIDANGAHLLLESGRAHLQVVHRPLARWRVSAGPFAVDVIGTRFDVQWNPEQDQFELDLAQGAVDVSGCAFGQGYHMRAGQRLEASCKRGRFDVSDAVRSTTLDRTDRAASEKQASALAPDTAPATGERRAREGRIARRAPQRAGAVESATASATGSPPARNARRENTAARELPADFEAQCASAGIEALASLAEAARYAGDREREGDAWRLLRQRFPGTSRAALAAFALGRLEFDVHGSYPKAAEWFGTYLKEQPAGALVREARGRLMEATLRAGDARAARALGAAYLRDYPAGPHAELARSLEQTPSP